MAARTKQISELKNRSSGSSSRTGEKSELKTETNKNGRSAVPWIWYMVFYVVFGSVFNQLKREISVFNQLTAAVNNLQMTEWLLNLRLWKLYCMD